MTEQTTSSTGKATTLARFVIGKVERIQGGLVDQQSSAAKATAARLRRALERPAGSVPEVWEITLGGFPESLIGHGDDPSAAEQAAHTALCLFAIHQQSQGVRMHQSGWGLGRSLRLLHQKLGGSDDLDSGPLIRRFNALSTADSLDEVLWHLRGLITQLRAAGIPLDYGRLVRDLYRYSVPEYRDSVRLRWGRDFYTYRPEATEDPSVTDSSVSPSDNSLT
ncbi:type I-E CRISPR-associated protein Cse2/CasB [Corynebacterium terpenotabidum]|uniref:CRISPR-associated Cse2 family protein n=1 Tax=Corynebacterium terpenotabidum Y-11 TaxID=1200352 RepID=S4XHC8_9CORY|nr:type I-E CRISPR-associated protein Cse2/CasB [Corynebacterium terpenotabidum]AGP31979.1 CRISPR-associated Cse2 family protein [Corynebacterium terpenotabidum Y-11]